MAAPKPWSGVMHAFASAFAGASSLFWVTGCGSGHATYPDGVTPATTTESAAQDTAAPACPNLVGRYVNTGRLAPDTPRELCKSALHSSKFRDIGDWECDVSLTSNLAGMDTSSEWVEVRQPDDVTVVVTWANPSVPFVELHRPKGEFDCTAAGLTRNLKASMTSQGYDQGQENTATKVYNVFAAISLAFTATGGVQTLKRTFSRSADGSLLMHVERTTHGVMFALPVDKDYSTWVTWPPEPPTESPPATPTLPAGPQN
jgi:hypothetical protein